jgi:ferric hydroxamate transport system substrate-binding protein
VVNYAPASFVLPTRRLFLGGVSAFLWSWPCSSRAGASRLASLSWAVSETLYALGAIPVAAAETQLYDTVVGSPATPAGTVDVGLQGAPNLEYLAQLEPDIIFIQSWQEDLRAALGRCGRVESVALYTGQGDAFINACAATRKIGADAGMDAHAGALIAQSEERLEILRDRLKARELRHLLLVQMIDEANLTVFTGGSLFDGVIRRLGFTNAWTGAPTLLWGGAVVGLEQLAELPDATIVLIDAPSLAPSETLTRGPLWRALPNVRSGRFVRLRSFWGFGALPTALRFAEALADAIA